MKWISIKDELPKISEERKADGFKWLPVMVYANDMVMSYTGEAIFYFEKNKFEISYRFHNIDLSNFVTHWMPLPKTPTEG